MAPRRSTKTAQPTTAKANLELVKPAPKSTNLELPKVAYDPGNRSVLLSDGQATISLPSVFVPLIPGHLPKHVKGQTVVINHEGQGFLVGQMANFDKQQRIRLFDADKVAEMAMFLCAALARYIQETKQTNIDSIEISELAVNMTEGDNLSPAVALALQKVHKFTLGEQEVSVKVKEVATFEEGLGAYYLYTKEQPHTDPNLLRAVINLGGGTADGLLVTNEGDVLEIGFRSRKGGCIALAEMVQRHLIRQGFTIESKDLDLILDAMHRAYEPVSQGGEPDFTLLQINGWGFDDVFPELLANWYKQLMGSLKTTFHAYFSQIECFIVTGGGAYLLADKFAKSPLFVMTDNPAIDNVIGLL
jgi:hypothetical protein